MPYDFYLILHLFGIFLLIAALGGLSLHAANGGTKHSNRSYRAIALTHGIGLLLILVAGFGMLARLEAGFPAWAWAKLIIWILLGAAVAIPYRKPKWALPLLFIVPLLALLSAYFAIYKPF